MNRKTFLFGLFLVTILTPGPLPAQWTNAHLPSNRDVLSLAVAYNSIYAATNGGGVFRSMDSGLSWTPVNAGLTGKVVVSLTVRDSNVFAGTYSFGVFRSTVGDTSWVAAAPLAYRDVYSLAASPNGD